MIPIGLILLSVLAVLTFFGVAGRFFRKIGIPDWLAFVLVLAFVIGAVVPEIPIGGGRLILNVGGFIIPVIFLVILLSVSPIKKDMLRAVLAVIAVAGVTVAVRMLIRPGSDGLFLVTMAVTGILGGITAYLAGGTRLSTLFGAGGGILLGDIVNNTIAHVMYKTTMALGTRGVFDSIVTAAIVGIVLLEAVEAIKRATGEKTTLITTLNAEAAEDAQFQKILGEAAEEEEFRNYFEGTD